MGVGLIASIPFFNWAFAKEVQFPTGLAAFVLFLFPIGIGFFLMTFQTIRLNGNEVVSKFLFSVKRLDRESTHIHKHHQNGFILRDKHGKKISVNHWMQGAKLLHGAISDLAGGESSEEMKENPNLVQLYDETGREIFVHREVWRQEILPKSIRDNWDDAEKLYRIIIGAIEDGFEADVLDAAIHFSKIDSIPDRAACVLSIALMKNGKPDEAEEALKKYIERYGENGVVLTNLAKVYAEKGRDELAEETLWHALELEPNQENGVQWWAAIHMERSGEPGYIDALEKLESIEGSWRAKLWLAKTALERQDFERARRYYDELLAMHKALSPDAFMQISGDLGNAGRSAEAIELFGNSYDPVRHGFGTGNNLIRSYLFLKDHQNAKRILNKLFVLNNPFFRGQLKNLQSLINESIQEK